MKNATSLRAFGERADPRNSLVFGKSVKNKLNGVPCLIDVLAMLFDVDRIVVWICFAFDLRGGQRAILRDEIGTRDTFAPSCPFLNL